MKEGLKNAHVQDFLASLDKFVSSLLSARRNLEGKFQLHSTGNQYNLENLHEPSDYTAAGTRPPSASPVPTSYSFHTVTGSVCFPASNTELVEMLEGVLLTWAQQIEQVLTQSEQMRKEADDIGPSAELEHWKSRTATFNR